MKPRLSPSLYKQLSSKEQYSKNKKYIELTYKTQLPAIKQAEIHKNHFHLHSYNKITSSNTDKIRQKTDGPSLPIQMTPSGKSCETIAGQIMRVKCVCSSPGDIGLGFISSDTTPSRKIRLWVSISQFAVDAYIL